MTDTTYTCPHDGCGEPQHLDTDFFDWDEDGTAAIMCSKCGRPYTIARPQARGFGGGARRARLFVRSDGTDTRRWLRLTASNGQVLMTSEVYASTSNANRAVGDILRAMADVMEDCGYVVTKPEEAGR